MRFILVLLFMCASDVNADTWKISYVLSSGKVLSTAGFNPPASAIIGNATVVEVPGGDLQDMIYVPGTNTIRMKTALEIQIEKRRLLTRKIWILQTLRSRAVIDVDTAEAAVLQAEIDGLVAERAALP